MMTGESCILQLSKALNVYANIPEDEINKFIAIAHPKEFKRNDYFIKAGETQPWLGFVIFGVFRCYYIDDTGAEYTKHFLRENNFLAGNTRSLVDKKFADREFDSYSQAVEDSMVLTINSAEYRKLLTHPCWQEVIAKEIERIHKLEERRIRQLLLEDAETRYLSFLEDFPGIENRVKQSHIASYIGVASVSLSRIRAKLKSN